MNREIKKLLSEKITDENCSLCREGGFEVGQKTGYGAVIYKNKNWFATLSPRTGGNPETDFTIQLMPFLHLTHFSQVDGELGKDYGLAFSRLCRAMTAILMEEENLKAAAENRELSVSLGTYGKWTTWKEKKEHLHIKIYPFRGNIGQPYTVDSTFGKKEIFKDSEGEFVKMSPVKKVILSEERFDQLTKKLIALL